MISAATSEKHDTRGISFWVRKDIYLALILVALATFLFFFGINSLSVTDPDDVFYAETAKEMLAQKSFLVPLIFEQPQFEKPPLFFWLLMISYKLFGVNSVSARLVPGLFGLLAVLGTFLFLRRQLGSSIAFLSGAILTSALGWIGLSRVVVTDLVFSVFIAFGLYCFFLWYQHNKDRYLYLFAVFAALASLAKSPLGAAMAVFIGITFLVLMKDFKKLRGFLMHPWWVLFLILALPWYIYISAKYGQAFLGEFFVHDHWDRLLRAEHRQFDRWYFYPVVITAAMFPWTAYLALIGKSFENYRSWYIFLFVWIGTVFVLFSIAHSKLSTYVSPIYPALAICLGITIQESGRRTMRFIVAGIIALALGVAFNVPTMIAETQYPEYFIPALMTMGALSLSSIISGILLFQAKLKAGVIVNVAGMILFTVAATTLVLPKLEGALTDSDLPAILAEYNYREKPILCTKLYVRGVYFSTGYPVTVVADGPDPFWSKHPVKIISSTREIEEYFKGYDTLLCVLSKGRYEDFKTILSGLRNNREISKNLDRYVILSSKIEPPNSK